MYSKKKERLEVLQKNDKPFVRRQNEVSCKVQNRKQLPSTKPFSYLTCDLLQLLETTVLRLTTSFYNSRRFPAELKKEITDPLFQYYIIT
jgi:hypothetical protein